jgi:LPS sulfotransferase NodH
MYNYYLHLRTYLTIKRKQFLNSTGKKTDHYKPFIILCEPRTGSTLLHTYLNFHPSILSYGEILREQIEKNHNGCLLKLQEDIFKPHASHISTVGLKLFYYYYDHPAYSNIFKQIIERKDIKVIHLQRQDVFKLFVSLKVAQKSNVWSVVKKDERKQKVWIDPDEFKAFAETYVQRQRFFDNLFQEHLVHKVIYENMVEHSTVELDRIQKFLGVKPRTLLSLLQKQTSNDVTSIVMNYGQISKVIEQIKNDVCLALIQ